MYCITFKKYGYKHTIKIKIKLHLFWDILRYVPYNTYYASDRSCYHEFPNQHLCCA